MATHEKTKSKAQPSPEGRWIRDVREARDESRDVFAELLKVSKDGLAKWELGNVKKVPLSVIQAAWRHASVDLRARCPVSFPADLQPSTSTVTSDPPGTVEPIIDSLEAFLAAHRRELFLADAETLRSIGPKVERNAALTIDEWRQLAEVVLGRKIPPPPGGGGR